MNTKFMNLPTNKTLQIIRGVLEQTAYTGNKIELSMTSRHVVECIRLMLMRFSIMCVGHTNTITGAVSTYRKKYYNLTVPNHPLIVRMFNKEPDHVYTWFEYNNYLYSRITKIDKCHYKGLLYDFEVDKDPSYVTHIGIAHNGGNKRPGAFAMYLEPWHADIFDFLELKKNTGKEEMRARDLFYAMWINDLFMERVEADGDWSLMCPNECKGLDEVYGDEFKSLYTMYESQGKFVKVVKAQKVWAAIIESQMETGGPYMCYKDSINRKSNQKNLGTIKSSNLCVAPETFILTDKGQKHIGELEGQSITVWNGFEWSKTKVVKTNEDVELLKVVLSNGADIECTPYHKFILEDCSHVEAQNLKEGSKILKCESIDKPIEGTEPFKYAYTHGLFCADGTYDTSNGRPRISLYDKKKLLMKYIDIRTTSGEEDNQNRINVQLPLDIPRKYEVPINSSVNDKLRWLEGYLDGDGCACRCSYNNKTNITIQVCSINKPFLNNVRIMLQTLGVECVIRLGQKERMTLMPDGKGGKKEFLCKEIYRLQISAGELVKLKALKFSPKRLDITTNFSAPQTNVKRFITVEKIIKTGRRSDTYCVNEPRRHSVIFNGVLTMNCVEICEYTSPEEIAVCNLASIGLPSYLNMSTNVFDFELLKNMTKIITYNLNNVINNSYYPVINAEKSNKRHRPIGIGVQGLADVFMKLKIAFDSKEAKLLNQQIFESIYYGALEASTELAKELGPYDTYVGSPSSNGILQYDMWNVQPTSLWDWNLLKDKIKQYGLRNSLLVAPMPTASTSQILNFNEAFEPVTSNIYSRRVLSGEFQIVNQYLINDLIKLNLWDDGMRQLIIKNEGSIQAIPSIPDNIKSIYKTVWEISQKVIVDMAADRGAFIDQSQSMNIFMAVPTYAKLTSMHFYAWKKGLKTGSYYIRSKPASSPIQFTITDTSTTTGTGVSGADEGPVCRKEEGCLVCSS
jgi:ribonucleoside-diphosphate reductase alpha chain